MKSYLSLYPWSCLPVTQDAEGADTSMAIHAISTRQAGDPGIDMIPRDNKNRLEPAVGSWRNLGLARRSKPPIDYSNADQEKPFK